MFKKAAANPKSNSTIAHYNLGLSYFKQNKEDEAIKHFKTALTIDSKHINASLYLGIIYTNRKNLHKA